MSLVTGYINIWSKSCEEDQVTSLLCSLLKNLTIYWEVVFPPHIPFKVLLHLKEFTVHTLVSYFKTVQGCLGGQKKKIENKLMCSISVGKHQTDVNLCGFIVSLFQPRQERNVVGEVGIAYMWVWATAAKRAHFCSQNSLEGNWDCSRSFFRSGMRCAVLPIEQRQN